MGGRPEFLVELLRQRETERSVLDLIQSKAGGGGVVWMEARRPRSDISDGALREVAMVLPKHLTAAQRGTLHPQRRGVKA